MSTRVAVGLQLLEVLVIPLAIALIALAWPEYQARNRKIRFERLIERELAEASPYPDVMTGGSDWKGYGRAYFIHRKIFEDPSTNRDFILSLDANLAYCVGQLWAAFNEGDQAQWMHYLAEIGSIRGFTSVTNVHQDWHRLFLSSASPKGSDSTSPDRGP
jgi:hypothetical protein